MSATDRVCDDYSIRGVRLHLSTIDGAVLIEGDSTSLEFLGKLLLAQASPAENSSHKQLSPSGAGKIFFAPNSQLGIYVHRLPCPDCSPT
jgi:hypothetical protein